MLGYSCRHSVEPLTGTWIEVVEDILACKVVWRPMMLSLDEAKILREVVGGITEVAQKVAATPTQQRARALQAAERHYQKMMLAAGSSASAARRWVEAVMDRIRRQVAEHDQKRSLTALHQELTALAEQGESSQSDSGDAPQLQTKVALQPRFAILATFDLEVTSRILNLVKKLAIFGAIVRDLLGRTLHGAWANARAFAQRPRNLVDG